MLLHSQRKYMSNKFVQGKNCLVAHEFAKGIGANRGLSILFPVSEAVGTFRRPAPVLSDSERGILPIAGGGRRSNVTGMESQDEFIRVTPMNPGRINL